MQKIHRRKNGEIAKEFACTEGCGKAYGSYAALYTHVKNKHSDARLPEMKAGSLKGEPARKPRPVEPVLPQPQSQFYPYDCKICKKVVCFCEEDINLDELERAIAVMGDQTYIKFINYIGGLHFNDKLSWIRNTEETFEYLSKERLREMAYEFNVKYASFRENQVILSNRWLEYLSYTSRVIDREAIVELYNGIFMILSKESLKDIEGVFSDLNEFETIRRCIEVRSKEWHEFMQFIKVI